MLSRTDLLFLVFSLTTICLVTWVYIVFDSNYSFSDKEIAWGSDYDLVCVVEGGQAPYKIVLSKPGNGGTDITWSREG